VYDLLDLDAPIEHRLRRPATTASARAMVDRVVDVAARLWSERDLEEITVLEICNEAGISISSFYARFSGKDELMRAVQDRYRHEVRRRIAAGALAFDWSIPDLEVLARRAIREYLAIRLEFASMYRTMARLEARHPEVRTTSRTEDELAFSTLAELYVATRVADGPDRAEAARRVAFLGRVVVAVANDLAGFQRTFTGGVDGELDRLAAQLGELCASHLRDLDRSTPV